MCVCACVGVCVSVCVSACMCVRVRMVCGSIYECMLWCVWLMYSLLRPGLLCAQGRMTKSMETIMDPNKSNHKARL